MTNDIWSIEASSLHYETKTLFFGFGRGYSLGSEKDLRQAAKRLPEGITICASQYVAGPEHIKAVLRQASEYWARNLFLARNRSIDLLMRLTCQDQISKAIEASQLDKISRLVLFGIATDQGRVASVESFLLHLGAKRNDSLLQISTKKGEFLRRFHSLPSWAGRDRLALLLEEKSVLLSIPR